MWEKGEVTELKSATILQKKEGMLYYQQVSTQEASRVKLRLLVSSDKGADVVYTFLWKETDKDVARNERDVFKNALVIKMGRSRQTVGTEKSNAKPEEEDSELTLGKKRKANDENSMKITDEDLKARQNILSSNVELAHLHKSLVVSGIISEDVFWESRMHLIREYEFQSNIKKGEDSMWIELAPSVQDNGNFKYTITPEVAKALFKQYPQIKDAYINNVPHKIQEKVFWKRFLASQFFNRNKSTSLKVGKDNIFDKCMDEEDKFLNGENQVDTNQILTILDLTKTEEDHTETGNEKDITMQPGKNVESLLLIRRFNRHSEQVLMDTLKNENYGMSASTNREKMGMKEMNKQELEKSIIIEDLEKHDENIGISLKLDNTERYFDNSKNNEQLVELSKEEQESIVSYATDQLSSIQGKIKLETSSKVFITVFESITKSLRNKTNQVARAKKAVEIMKEGNVHQRINELYLECYELCRHMFVVTKLGKNDNLNRGSNLEEKVKKSRELSEAITKYGEKVDSVFSKFNENQKAVTSKIVERIKSCIEAALEEHKNFMRMQSILV
ncbi:hypothetical protein BB559_005136 [Furculomyces boomerangus]|uniref:BSD domain-containing protein n=1 Tax=Furculomyces boomerangus TaxID=61424 RepID=A0A2T9YAK4_9FUNG|nr:hypothetical protein BB559_005136 [Furculomyces boomerangus]